MGLLKNLLKPSKKNFVKAIYDPAGAVKGAIDDSKQPGSPAAPAEVDPNAINDQSNSYYGDPNDPGYGDFTKPFDAEEFYKYQDPGYWFRLQQGQQGLQNSAAAGSGALSGAAMKDLLGYNQDMASQEYGNAFNRYQTTQGNIFQRLMGIAQLGQGAAANTGSVGTNLAGNAGQAIANAGTASGSGIVGAGNAIGQGATNAWLWGTPEGRKIWQAGTGGV